MSQAQFQATVADEEEFRYEIAERERLDALEIAAEMNREREFAEELAEKYPILRAWPGKTKS
jgi:hypothetical protein